MTSSNPQVKNAINIINNTLESMKKPSQYGTELTKDKLDKIATPELGYLLNIMHQQWEIIKTVGVTTNSGDKRRDYERATNILRETLITILDEGHKTNSRKQEVRKEYYTKLARHAGKLNAIWHSITPIGTPRKTPNAPYTEEYMERRNTLNADKEPNTLRGINAANIITLWEAELRKSVAKANKNALDESIRTIYASGSKDAEAKGVASRAATGANYIKNTVMHNLDSAMEQLNTIIDSTSDLIIKRENQLTSEALSGSGENILHLIKTPKKGSADGKEVKRKAEQVSQHLKAYSEITSEDKKFEDIDADMYIDQLLKDGE